MKSMAKQIQGEELSIGIDLHKRRWHVTIRADEVEIFSSSIAGRWQELKKVLNQYKGCRIHAVYEAGYSGFWLFDHLANYVCGLYRNATELDPPGARQSGKDRPAR